jgi:transcriptional regulator of arginine metabolism
MEVIKRLRQQQIRDLIATRTVRTQHELAAALRERGYRATQATISRDVSEMGLIKQTRNGERGYAVQPRVEQPESSGEERLASILRDLPVEIRPAGLMIVVKAVPGSAHAIAAALDRSGWDEVAGSIAGDDTVFIATSDRRGAERVRRRLMRLASLSSDGAG